MAAPKRRLKKSAHDDAIKLGIALGVAGILLVVFGVLVHAGGGVPALLTYLGVAFAACVIAFLGLAFLPVGSKWAMVVFWGWPITAILAASLQLQFFGWLLGYGVGIVLGARVARARHDRSGSQRMGEDMLLSGAGPRGRVAREALTSTALRDRLAALDGEAAHTLTARRGERLLCVFGAAPGPLVVCFTENPRDDSAWRRLVTPGGAGDGAAADREVEVPMGGIAGTYRAQSTVGVDLARQAGDHFIRTGDMDPSLEWESGEDVFNRLPPTRIVR